MAQAVQGTGIGPALRRARLERGKSIEEASRETRIRADFLQALEQERFDTLPGDVYVRGFVRTYANYLGLDPARVVARLRTDPGERGDAVAFRGVPAPARPSAPPMPKPIVSGRRHRLSWPVMGVVTVVVLALLAAVGMFSARRTAPPPAPIPSNPPAVGANDAQVIVAVTANAAVKLTVTADGEVVFDRVLAAGEGRTFVATDSIRIDLARGGSAEINANGNMLGAPGNAKEPYNFTFFPVDQRFVGTPGPTSGDPSSPTPNPSPS